MNHQVTILMATYNGGNYLEKQIESIINQTYTNWVLWIRDDNSSDATNSIIQNFVNLDKRIFQYVDNKRNLGCCANFSELLQNVNCSDYIMFADQDDYWLEDKIEISLKEFIKNENSSLPLLLFTDKQFADIELNEIETKKYNKNFDNAFNKLLAQPYIYGCTMLFNKSLLNKINPVPSCAENHDYWVSLVASIVGNIVYLSQKSLLYRQHSNNVTANYKSSIFTERLKRILNFSIYIDLFHNRIILFKHLQNHLTNLNVSNDKMKFLDCYLQKVQKGGFSLFLYTLRNGISNGGVGIGSTILYLFITLIYKYKSE